MKQHKQMMMKVSDLKNIEKNARKHSPVQIQQIKESISRFGFISPVVIDSKNIVQAGNGRLEAARLLGLDTVPAIKVEGLTASELRAYALIDNRLGDLSFFDIDILREELEELSFIDDLDLSTIGFSAEEIEGLLKIDDFKPDLPEDDEDKEPSAMTHKLTIECEDDDQKQDLFDELKERGFKIKA